MYRRRLLSIAATSVAFPAWFRYAEPRWFELTHTRISIRIPRPVRLLHLADFHISDGMTAEELEAGLQLGLGQRPDLICLTGDFISTTVAFDRHGLKRLVRLATDAAPTFAVLGNHDGGAWLARQGGSASHRLVGDLVQSAGAKLLHNASASFAGLNLVGLGDLWSGQIFPAAAFASAPEPSIVLAHNPDTKDMLSNFSWQLMLSGHTHGGQARIPGVTPAWAPVADKRFISGLHRWEGRQLFITRGIGSPKRIRAFCRPEVSVLDLVPEVTAASVQKLPAPESFKAL